MRLRGKTSAVLGLTCVCGLKSQTLPKHTLRWRLGHGEIAPIGICIEQGIHTAIIVSLTQGQPSVLMRFHPIPFSQSINTLPLVQDGGDV